MKPHRLQYTFELLEEYGIFQSNSSNVVGPRTATEDELLSFHTQKYIECVRRVNSKCGPLGNYGFGLGSNDNPVFEGIYDAAILSTGASMTGVDLLISGNSNKVFSIAGGLHHAMPNNASGFCIFNDPVLAINKLLDAGMKVAYVDIDCHHGDGVQYAFYHSDKVLTISIHESGEYLFPGTGFLDEIGSGKGRGYSVNLPLYPETGDEVYLWGFRNIVNPLLHAFKADIVVTQLGIDTHFSDPLTHLSLTTQGFANIVDELSKSAPLWLALGGGGYNPQTVARGWALAYSKILGEVLPDRIPTNYHQTHGVAALTDHSWPKQTTSTQSETKNFAETNILKLQKDIFPMHHIQRT